MMATTLARPSLALLPGFVDALRRGWSRSNIDAERIAREDLAAIGRDPSGFVAGLDDRDARGAPIRLPDGSTVPRLPGFDRWILAGDVFCGAIGMRWQPGTAALPSHVLGHVGFAVVPWQRGHGHATAALSLLLHEIGPLGLPWVELTADPTNTASQREITANGGVLVGRFRKDPAHGGTISLRYRTRLDGPPD